jgi:hypothetical protein
MKIKKKKKEIKEIKTCLWGLSFIDKGALQNPRTLVPHKQLMIPQCYRNDATPLA